MIRRFVFVFLVLCLPSFAFAQAFNVVSGASQYPNYVNGVTIPVHNNQAVLKLVSRPVGSYSSNFQVLSVDILPSFTANSSTVAASYGWVERDFDGDVRITYSIIDASNLYVRSAGISEFVNNVLPHIQDFLERQNLGTVQQRAAYIAGFKVKNVNIIDTSSILASFKDLLGPWANIAVGLMIALFALEFGTRNTKQLAGDAAKEARAADRRVQSREIRDDPIAGQFRAHMDNLASVFRDTYGFYDSSTRAEAKELFDQAALDYAKYKKSRGWAL